MEKERKSLIGTTAMAGSSALRVVIQVGILPVIGRLLGPQAYGQIALVSPFVFFAMMLAESGFGACIIGANEVTEELKGTILVFSVGLSISIILLFGLIAYPLGILLHEPLFPYLLVSMSTILLLAAFAIVPTALLLRSKRYDCVALSDIASSAGSLVGVGVGIGLGWGVWSLVAQQVLLWTAKVFVLTVSARWHPSFVFKRSVLNEHLSFSSRLTGSNILSFVAKNIDNVLIGALMGAQTLGFYALAFQIVGLPAMVLSGSIYFTVLSNVSESRRAGIFPRDFILKVLRCILMIGTPTIVGLAATASISVPLLLGDKWLPMITIIILLAPLGFQQMITSMTQGAIVGLARSDLILHLTFISSTMTVGAIIVGIFFSSAAVAVGVSLSALVTCILHLSAVAKSAEISLPQIVRTMTGPLLSSAVMGGIVYFERIYLFSTFSLISQLLSCISTGILIYAAIIFIFFREEIGPDISMLRDTVFSRRAASGK